MKTSNSIFNKAIFIIEESDIYFDKGQYIKGWGISLKSRPYFLLSTIESIAKVSFYLINSFFSFMLYFASWGREGDFKKDISNLLENVNLTLISSIGIIAPFVSVYLKDTNLIDGIYKIGLSLLPVKASINPVKQKLNLSWQIRPAVVGS